MSTAGMGAAGSTGTAVGRWKLAAMCGLGEAEAGPLVSCPLDQAAGWSKQSRQKAVELIYK